MSSNSVHWSLSVFIRIKVTVFVGCSEYTALRIKHSEVQVMTFQAQQVTRVLHWLSALFIIGLLGSGIYMADGNDYALYDWHKAFGVIALLLVIIRLYHRKVNPWQSSAKGSQHEKYVQLMHQFLLTACVLMPISGLIYSGLGGFGVDVFGIEIIPHRYSENGQVLAFNQAGSDIGKAIHYYLGYLMTALVLIHVAAALKHHFIDKDTTLSAMIKAKNTH